MPLPAIAAAAGALALRELAKEGGGAAGRGLVGAAGRGFCNVHANNPNIIGRLGSIASDFADGACKPYFDENGITPPVPTQNPFSGGQCLGVLYSITVEVYQDGFGVYTREVGAYGPIGGIAIEDGAPGNVLISVRGYDYAGNPTLVAVAPTQAQNASTARIVSVQRQDGEVDSCGDLPNQYDPSPNAPRVNYGDPFDGEDFGGRQSPITIFAPSLNPDGSISIPIDIDGTPADLGSPSSPAGGKPEDNAPVEPGDAKEPAPEDGGKVCFNAIAGKELVGVSWSLTVPEAFGEIPDTLVPIYPRVIGNIRLLLGACDTVTGTIENQIQIRTAKGTVFRSVGGTPVAGAIINTLPGVVVSLTPLYVSIEEDE